MKYFTTVLALFCSFSLSAVELQTPSSEEVMEAVLTEKQIEERGLINSIKSYPNPMLIESIDAQKGLVYTNWGITFRSIYKIGSQQNSADLVKRWMKGDNLVVRSMLVGNYSVFPLFNTDTDQTVWCVISDFDLDFEDNEIKFFDGQVLELRDGTRWSLGKGKFLFTERKNWEVGQHVIPLIVKDLFSDSWLLFNLERSTFIPFHLEKK